MQESTGRVADYLQLRLEYQTSHNSLRNETNFLRSTRAIESRQAELLAGAITKQNARQEMDLIGGQCRTRTCDLLLVRQAL